MRTLQRFDDAGRLACLYLMREERVLDAVTGAVDRYAPMAAAAGGAASS